MEPTDSPSQCANSQELSESSKPCFAKLQHRGKSKTVQSFAVACIGQSVMQLLFDVCVCCYWVNNAHALKFIHKQC